MGSKAKSAAKYLGKENYNNQGYLMKVIEYNGYDNIIVEFSEPYKNKVKTRVDHFLKGDIRNPYIYFDKPDLQGTEHTAFRFVNAISDYATHTTDHKETRNYKENLFMRTVDGHPLIDTAYELAKAV